MKFFALMALVGATLTAPLAHSSELTLDQAAKLVAEGSPFDITFRKEVSVTVYKGNSEGPIVGTVKPSTASKFVSSVRANVPERTIAAEQPVKLGWQSIYFGSTKIYDINDFYNDLSATKSAGENDDEDDWGFTVYEMDRALVGVIGHVVTTLQSSSGYGDGAAHPIASTDLTSVDGRTGLPLSLLEIATEDSIVHAFKTNDEVRACLPAENLPQLDAASNFAEVDKVLTDFSDMSLCSGSYPTEGDILKRFAITGYDAQTNRMSITLERWYGSEVTRGLFFAWQMQVEPKADFRAALVKAAAKESGFLTDAAKLPEDNDENLE